MSRKTQFAPGEYYHVYNRGAHKADIFHDNADYARFLFALLYFQSPQEIRNINRYIAKYLKKGNFGVKEKIIEDICTNRIVELVNFTLMPNHFHATVCEIEEGGVSKYMHRVASAFSQAFNTKYDHSGHVFQGPFQSVHIASDKQLLHLSAYIHRNPRELKVWKGKEVQYPWSSFRDYVEENTWEGLLSPDIVLDRFSGGKAYRQFVDTSGIKESPTFSPILE